MKRETMKIEESLESIAIRLDELTGNAMGNSYLNVSLSDVPETDLGNVEDELSKLNEKIDKLTESVDSIAIELQSLSTISETLENMLAFYIQFNENKQ
jgi:predicted nuclease with TOPRIM domain